MLTRCIIMFIFLALSLREDYGIVDTMTEVGIEARRQVLAMADHHQMTYVAISEAVEEIMEVAEEVRGYWMDLSVGFIRLF
jgi:hypothetical protein